MRHWRNYPVDPRFQEYLNSVAPDIAKSLEGSHSKGTEQSTSVTAQPEVIVPEKAEVSKEIHISSDNNAIKHQPVHSEISEADPRPSSIFNSFGGFEVIILIALFFIFVFRKY